MAIEFIDNQTIKFTSETDESDCLCRGQKYCQPVRTSDTTNFQLIGNILNADPSFQEEYNIAWEQYTAIILTADSEKISAEGVCDGTITAVASAGSGSGYVYSIDGGAFGGSGSFTGLCEGEHLITVMDSDGHYASMYVTVGGEFDCSTLNGSDANDVLLIEGFTIKNCYANDLI